MPAEGAPAEDNAPEAGWHDLEISAQDGLALHVRAYGARHPGRLPVVCLPGLTRSARDFHELSVALSTHGRRPRRVLAIDMRGRGGSERDRNWRNYNPLTEAGDVLDVMAATGVAHAAFVGTSRGGIVAMVLGALRPTALKAVVFNDIGPEIDGRGLIRIKNMLSAMRTPDSWEAAATLLKGAHAAGFPKLDDRDWMVFARKTFADADGRPRADFDAKILKPLTRMDFGRPLPALWPQFDALAHIPLMAIRGANSDILSAKTLAQMRARRPDLHALEVADAGHAPFLMDAESHARIAAFIAGAEGGR